MYTTITDLATDVADRLGLDSGDVRDALMRHRTLWGRYEDIDSAQREALCRAVWTEVVPDAEYPFEEAR